MPPVYLLLEKVHCIVLVAKAYLSDQMICPMALSCSCPKAPSCSCPSCSCPKAPSCSCPCCSCPKAPSCSCSMAPSCSYPSCSCSMAQSCSCLGRSSMAKGLFLSLVGSWRSVKKQMPYLLLNSIVWKTEKKWSYSYQLSLVVTVLIRGMCMLMMFMQSSLTPWWWSASGPSSWYMIYCAHTQTRPRFYVLSERWRVSSCSLLEWELSLRYHPQHTRTVPHPSTKRADQYGMQFTMHVF